MTKTTRLNDLQLILLSHAAKNDDGSVHPLPAAATQDEARTAKELKALVRGKLLAETGVTDRTRSWREDANRLFGLVITPAGHEALGTGEAETQADQPEGDEPAKVAISPRTGSKIATVIVLLQREQGATLDEMVQATGWLPHTTRASLTGLKKKGHTIEKSKRDEVTCYRIVAGN